MWQNRYCWCLYGHVCAFGLTFVSACGKITIADVCMAMFVPLVWRLSLHVAKSLLLMFVWPCLCLWFDVCLCMWQNHYCWCLYGHVCAFGLTFVSACGKITIADVCAFGLTFVSVCGTSVVWCASVLVITGAHHTTFVWPACDFGVQTSVDGLHQLRSSRGSFLRGERSCTKPFKYFLGLCCCVVTSVNSCQNWSFEIWCLGMVCTWSASLVCTVGCFAYVCVCVCWMQAACLVDNWQTSKVGYIMWLFSLPPLPFSLPPWEISHIQVPRGVLNPTAILGVGLGVFLFSPFLSMIDCYWPMHLWGCVLLVLLCYLLLTRTPSTKIVAVLMKNNSEGNKYISTSCKNSNYSQLFGCQIKA